MFIMITHKIKKHLFEIEPLQELIGMAHHIKELFSLGGKVAVVTGGAGLLGSEMSTALAEAGAHVIIADRDVDNCCKRAEEISRDNPEAMAIRTDVTDESLVQNMVDETVNKFGRLDILVNCAGEYERGKFEEMSLDVWNMCISSYLTSIFTCTQKAMPVMKKQGGGNIINISSMYGMIGPDFRVYGDSGRDSPPHYNAAKGGVIQFTRYCASYLAPYNIRVNTISPGSFPVVDPEKNREFLGQLGGKSMLDRVGEPWEMKGIVVFLASDASSYITGQNIAVDGGVTAW